MDGWPAQPRGPECISSPFDEFYPARGPVVHGHIVKWWPRPTACHDGDESHGHDSQQSYGSDARHWGKPSSCDPTCDQGLTNSGYAPVPNSTIGCIGDRAPQIASRMHAPFCPPIGAVMGGFGGVRVVVLCVGWPCRGGGGFRIVEGGLGVSQFRVLQKALLEHLGSRNP